MERHVSAWLVDLDLDDDNNWTIDLKESPDNTEYLALTYKDLARLLTSAREDFATLQAVARGSRIGYVCQRDGNGEPQWFEFESPEHGPYDADAIVGYIVAISNEAAEQMQDRLVGDVLTQAWSNSDPLDPSTD